MAGDCSTNYIEVKIGSEGGRVLRKYCFENPPTGSFRTFANQIFIRFVKGSLTSSFDGVWTAIDLQCCDKVMLENHASRNGEYHWNANDDAYQKVGAVSEPELLFRTSFIGVGPIWAVGSSPKGSGYGLYSSDVPTCPEYIRGFWKYWAGSE